MKKTLVSLVALGFLLAPLTANAETWTSNGDGWSDGMMQFGTIAFALFYLFKRNVLHW